MEVEEQDCAESDPEDEEQPDNEVQIKPAGEEEEEEDMEGDEEGHQSGADEEQQDKVTVAEEDWFTCSEDDEHEEDGGAGSSNKSPFHNSSRLLHKDELLEMFKAVHSGPRCKEGQLTVGLVGEKLNTVQQTANGMLQSSRLTSFLIGVLN